jgi:hypothetical protein
MNVSSNVMAKTMWEEIIRNSLIPKLLNTILSIEEAKTLQPSNDFFLSNMMKVLPINSRLQLSNTLSISLQHNIINVSLFLGELAIGWECSGDVRAITI